MTASTTWRHVGWRGADDARRVDSAETELGPDWLLARGESVTPAYALTWSLTTVSGWVTETLRVNVDGGTWSRSLTLRRLAGNFARPCTHNSLAADRDNGKTVAACAKYDRTLVRCFRRSEPGC